MNNQKQPYSAKPHWMVLALLIFIVILLVVLLTRSDNGSTGNGGGDTSSDAVISVGRGIGITDPSTNKPLPLQKCGAKCQLFQSENRVISTMKAEIIATERVGNSATCCLTLLEDTRTSEGVATQSTLELCCTYSGLNQCSSQWWKDDAYDDPDRCNTEWK